MAEGKIRIKDVAKIAGVSATTVSNVIHGRTEKVSRKTRKRIEEILDEQEYAPSMGARILSGKSSGMIAVVVGKRQEWEQESEKLEEILREIEKSLELYAAAFCENSRRICTICGGMETGWRYLYLAQ